ncbi:MAG TPA: TSUP family transporter, partial [Chitinophagaceae bacterium]
IDLKVVGVMCAAFVFGGWLGSKLALSLPQEVVKKVFAIVLFYTAFKMLGWDTVFFNWVKGWFN